MTYLLPASSPETTAPSTIVNEPIPGKTNDFSTSVPVAVALIKQTFAFSNADCPWSPHSLTHTQKKESSIIRMVISDIITCMKKSTYRSWRSYFLLLSDICPGDFGDGEAMLNE